MLFYYYYHHVIIITITIIIASIVIENIVIIIVTIWIALLKVVSTFLLLQQFYSGVILVPCAWCVCNFFISVYLFIMLWHSMWLSYCSFLTVYVLSVYHFIMMSKLFSNEKLIVFKRNILKFHYKQTLYADYKMSRRNLKKSNIKRLFKKK